MSASNGGVSLNRACPLVFTMGARGRKVGSLGPIPPLRCLERSFSGSKLLITWVSVNYLLRLLRTRFTGFFGFVASSSRVFFGRGRQLRQHTVAGFSGYSGRAFVINFSPHGKVGLSSA